MCATVLNYQVLGREPGTSSVTEKHPTPELHPQPCANIVNCIVQRQHVTLCGYHCHHLLNASSSKLKVYMD